MGKSSSACQNQIKGTDVFMYHLCLNNEQFLKGLWKHKPFCYYHIAIGNSWCCDPSADNCEVELLINRLLLSKIQIMVVPVNY
jgi:hypothetical protein